MIEHPRVSIGIPVYNGERTLPKALTALLNQTYPHFEVVISDNASTDLTSEICRKFAEQDPRVKYHRQSKNLGAPANFQFVLDQCSATFFMWAAADDIHSVDFVEANLQFLIAHPDYVASISPVRFFGETFDTRRMGDASLEGDSAQRTIDFFPRKWHANGRFYSLVRRDALKSCRVIETSFLGSDWAVVLHLSQQGKMKRIELGSLELGRGGASQSKDIFKVNRKQAIQWIAPFAELSLYTWKISKSFAFMQKLNVAAALVRLNFIAFLVQFLVAFRGFFHIRTRT